MMPLGLAAGLVFGCAVAVAKEPLVVYTSTSAEVFARYKATFEALNPDIELVILEDSGGVLAARVLAERESPRADVLWDVPASSLVKLHEEGLLEPYAPANLAALDMRMRDRADPPAWTSFAGFGSVLCYNRIEAGNLNLPRPAKWEDLLDPGYRGQIVMPSPASSGTGFLIVAGLLQIFGEEQGWAYLDGLHANIAFYTNSGSKPCRLAGGGEYAIGLSFENEAVRVIDGGAPVDPILPDGGIFWEISGVAIVKGTENLDAARKLVDWAATFEANQLFAEDWAIVPITAAAKQVRNLPADFIDRIIDNDFVWIAANKDRIVEEWQHRYGTKTEAE
jgi:iron(III) transport system substrate-binding protein